MRERVLLTAIWLSSFLLALLVLESYIHVRDDEGIRILLPEDRWAVMRPIILLYSTYLSGILAFWFLRPFKSPMTDAAARVRFTLAGICTVLFNAVILYMLLQEYLFSGSGQHLIVNQVDTAVKIAAALSFVVGPANAYYFGMKSDQQ